jgi:hypothetical protein
VNDGKGRERKMDEGDRDEGRSPIDKDHGIRVKAVKISGMTV